MINGIYVKYHSLEKKNKPSGIATKKEINTPKRRSYPTAQKIQSHHKNNQYNGPIKPDGGLSMQFSAYLNDPA